VGGQGGSGGVGVFLGSSSNLDNSGVITGGNGGAGAIASFGSGSGLAGSAASGVYVGESSVSTITNKGTITGGTGSFGIWNDGTISALNNSQATLTYTAILPTNYNIIINSSIDFGKIAFSSPTGTTAFSISSLSGANIGAPNTRYQNVITGLSADNITNELTTFTYTNGLLSATYQLVEDDGKVANTWDLLILSPPLNIISGTSGNDVINGTVGADKIYGMRGNDTLDGGAGADILIGGDGSDTYAVDNAGDVVTEDNAGTKGGVDLVWIAISTAGGTYTLGSNLENATLTNTVAYNLTGNSLNNTLTGNKAVNTLNGGDGKDTLNGGAGADILIGGDGSDTYVVDSTADTITELFGGGTDLVQSSVTFSLANIAYVENLTLTGASAINAMGNTLDNTLTGNSGANTLNGGDGNDKLYGGLGKDTLTGGAGADHFVFNTALSGIRNKDTITDFTSGVDKIDLENSVMSALGLTTGTLASHQFWSGEGVVTGHDADDRIVYNTSTGALYYDADGSGSGGAFQIALIGLSIHPTLTYQDFLII